MLVHDEQATRNATTVFGAGHLDIDLILVGVEVFDVRRDLLALGVYPRPFADAIPSVDRGLRPFRLRAQVGAPCLAACTCLCRPGNFTPSPSQNRT